MLVLSRLADESLVFLDPETGEQVLKLTVLRIRGDKVSLGMEADPRKLKILRHELRPLPPEAEGASDEKAA